MAKNERHSGIVEQTALEERNGGREMKKLVALKGKGQRKTRSSGQRR